MILSTKLVIRLLDAQNQLLGWCAHDARSLGDGRLRADGPVHLVMRASGVVTTASIHWADINTVTVIPLAKEKGVTAGDGYQLFQDGDEMVRIGEPPESRLPPVTIGQDVTIGIPIHRHLALSGFPIGGR